VSLYEHPARRLEFAVAGALLVLLLQVGAAAGLQQPLLDFLHSQVEAWLLRVETMRVLLQPALAVLSPA